MARTQLRLDAVTGSLVAIEGAAKAAGVPSVGAAEHLEDVVTLHALGASNVTASARVQAQQVLASNLTVSVDANASNLTSGTVAVARGTLLTNIPAVSRHHCFTSAKP
jgi:hypothetical protein